MTAKTYDEIEAQIQGLLAEALPLRGLDADDPRSESLGGMIDQINRLRGQQATAARDAAILAPEPPPSREELERRARAAGISFSPLISDSKLAERIAEGAQ